MSACGHHLLIHRKALYLVHKAEDNFVFACVLSSQLRPEVDKLGVRGAALADDLTIPPRV